jgi:acyl-CoA dehydrogenase
MRDCEDDRGFAVLLQEVRALVREQLLGAEDEVEKTGRIPERILGQMKQLGLFGLTIPREYGGRGLSTPQEAEIVMELTWASAAFRSIIGINLGVGSQGLVMDGTEAQKRFWLPKIASGDVITSFALTEPDAGSDAAAIKTIAARDGDCYVLNGVKRYITNAPCAGVITVMARTHPDNLPRNAHVTAFLVAADTPGLSIGSDNRKMGQDGSLSADIVLKDVRVPAEDILGAQEGKGFSTAMKVLDRSRIHIAAVCTGQARRILHEALRHASTRKQFGQPIGEFELVQAMLADSQAELYAMECMVRETAQRHHEGKRVSLEASSIKMFASEAVGRIADRAVQIFGGAGYMKESVVERLYRDVRLFRIYEGTTQMQQIIIARNMTRNFAAEFGAAQSASLKC